MTENEILLQVISEGLAARRKKAKDSLVAAAKTENEIMVQVYFDQLKQIKNLRNKLEDALENDTHIQLLESIQEETKLLN